MRCGDKCIVGVMRTPQHQNRKGVFKIELCSKQDKIDVLHCKASLKHSREFQRVYLRSSMSHNERLQQLNFKTLLQEIPNGDGYRITGSGRLIKKRIRASHKERQ